MLDRFHRIIRNRNATALTSWLAGSETGLFASFCKGIKADLAAVTAVLTEPWSNGQTEGKIT
jgi:transposase